MVVCPWCNEWEGPPGEYSDHLQYCKKYPPNIEAMKEQARVRPIETSSLRKTDAELREIARTLLPIELMFFKAGKGWMLDRLAGLSKEEFSRLEEIVQQMYSRKSPEQSARSPEELPPGMCYREAYRFMLKEGDHLIHGKITSPADKRIVNHAWVEFETGWVWEPQTEKFMRKSEFEQFFAPKVEAKYTPKEAATLALKSRHYGPWHEILEEHSSDGFTNIEFSFEENPHTRTDYHHSSTDKIIRRLSPETIEWVREESKWRCPIASEEIEKYEREVRERKKLTKRAEKEWATERRVKIIELLAKHCPEALLEQ